jgi:hypothetical protein
MSSSTITSIGSWANLPSFTAQQNGEVRVYTTALTESFIRLLSQRRGIAYETKRNRSYRSAAVATNRRRRLLIGN